MTGAPRKYDDAQLIERVASCELARELRREKPNKELSYREATWGLTGDPKDSTSPRGAAIVRLRKLREAIDAAKADILRNSSALTVLPPSLINTADDPEMLTKKTGQNAAREMAVADLATFLRAIADDLESGRLPDSEEVRDAFADFVGIARAERGKKIRLNPNALPPGM